MNPLLLTALGPIIGQILDKVIAQLPVSENAKENAKLDAAKAVAEQAAPIAEAEAKIADSSKAVVLADLATGNLVNQLWRPIVAFLCAFLLFWEGFLIDALNAVFKVGIAYPPQTVSTVYMTIILTLIGARSVEKINLTRVIGKKV